MSAPTAESALRLDFVQPGIARITYDQPGSRANTLNQGVQTEFENILTQLEQTPNLQGLIFCSGKPGMFICLVDRHVATTCSHRRESYQGPADGKVAGGPAID